jgi:hypothetical protein
MRDPIRDTKNKNPEVETVYGRIPHSNYGHAVGWCPALGLGLGFRPNAPEVVKPDLYIFPDHIRGVILSQF